MNAIAPSPPKVRYGTKDDKSEDEKKKAAEAEQKKTAEAEEKKKADEKKPAEKKAAETGEFTVEQFTETIQKTVKAVLDASLPEHLKKFATEDSVKKAVADAVVGFEKDAKKITIENIAEASTKAAQAIVDGLRKEKKQHNDGDSRRGHEGEGAEYGECSLTKGNLPVHMKQLLNCLMKRPENDGIDAKDIAKGKELGDRMFMGLKTAGMKALTTTGTGTGLEWQPRDLSSELFRRLYLESKIAQAFLDREVQMPTDPYDYPLLTTNPIFFLNTTQNTEVEASQPGTGKITLATQKLMCLVQYSYEVDEDSIIPILPTLQDLLAKAAARSLENAIINGDTTATHMDSDVTDAKDQRRAWKGFRKLALAVAGLKVDITSGGYNRANLLAVLKLLGKYGAAASDLVWILGSKAHTALLGLDEFALGYYRAAPGGTFFGGPVPSPYGGQLVVSEMAREDLNASGVYDGSTTTKSAIILANKGSFILGSRREFTVETARNIRSQTNDIVASFRKAFIPVETPSATNQIVSIGYNVTA